jgi:hypothetical protein
MKRNPVFSRFEADWGIYLDGAVDFLKPEFARNYSLAMDAQPALVTAPNSGIPAFLVTFIDPDLLRVLQAKVAATEILEEVRKGDWTTQAVAFPVVEHTGEVGAYGDFSNNGRSSANTNFPQRQPFKYQTIAEYGELELEMAGEAKIGWAAELKMSSVNTLNRFQNLSYFRGISGLQNYGLQNDPLLTAPIAPAPKAAGGVAWFVNGATPNATANEVYNDIVSLVTQVINQSVGNIDQKSKFVLAMSPRSSSALNFTNLYNVNVQDMLNKNYPNLRVETAVQYGAVSTQNPQGIAGGELVQLIAEEVLGQKTAFCAFNVKLRAHPIIRDLSSFRQKMTQGTYGTVIRQPFAISQLIGV